MAVLPGISVGLELESQQFTTKLAAADRQMDQFASGVSRSSRGMRGQFQQIGFQLQDVIVQLQAGTSASIVFAQQGSQIAGAFGPVGAAVGVAIAAIGIAGGALLRLASSTESAEEATKRLSDTQDALKSLLKDSTKEIREQVAAIGELEGAAKGFAGRAFEGTLEAAEANLAAQEDRLREALAGIRQTIIESGELLGPGGLAGLDILTLTRTAAGGGDVQRLGDQVDALIDQLDDPRLEQFDDELTAAGVAAAAAQKQVDELRGAIGDLAEGADLTGVNALIKEFEQGQKDAERAAKDAARAAEQAARAREREQQAALSLQDQLLDGMKKQAQALDKIAERAHEAIMTEGAQVFDATRTEAEQYAATLTRLRELLAAGAIGQETFNRALKQAQDDLNGVSDAAEIAAEAKQLFARSASSGIADAVFQAKSLGQALEDVAKSFGKAILEALTFRAIMAGIDAFAGSFGGTGGATQAQIDIAGAALTNRGAGAPGRAAGGPVSPGMVYQVGERGPEFFVPNVAGQIIPNGGGGGGQAPTINIIDQRGKGAPPVETSVDFRGVVTATIRAEVGSMARDGSLGMMTGNRRKGIARG